MRKETLSIKSRGKLIRYLGQFKDDFVFSRFIFSVRFVKRLDYTFALQLETMVYSDKQLNGRVVLISRISLYVVILNLFFGTKGH